MRKSVPRARSRTSRSYAKRLGPGGAVGGLLIACINTLLRWSPKKETQRRSVPKPGSSSELQGTLGSFALSEVIQLLHEKKKTGVLCLRRTGAQGEIYFRGGDVLCARVGRSKGGRAFRTLMEWRKGSFAFVPGPVTRRRTIRQHPITLLIDAARILDERRRNRAA